MKEFKKIKNLDQLNSDLIDTLFDKKKIKKNNVS